MSEFESEEQIRISSDSVNINNWARTLLTPTGVRGLQLYWEQFAQYGIRSPIIENPEHYESQIHFLMHTFGPMFADGKQEPPFTTISLGLKDSRNAPSRLINVNDFVYLGLTPDGEAQLGRYFPNQRYIRRVGSLFNLQFHTIAHVFGVSAIPGGDYTIKDNTLYMPR